MAIKGKVIGTAPVAARQLRAGDRLVRFRSELQQTMPRLHEGVVWQRGSETLSGIVTHTEWLTAEDVWMASRCASQPG